MNKYSDREFLRAYVNASMWLNELSDCPVNELEGIKDACIEQLEKMVKLAKLEYLERSNNGR